MAIPDFQTIFLPFLKLLADGNTHSINDADQHLAEHFHLTPEERSELLPSGKQARFRNRVNWSASYLYQAKLIDRVTWGVYRITERGKELLKRNPTELNTKSLGEYEEFRTFQTKSGTKPEATEHKEQRTETPEEILEATHLQLRSLLATNLLERVRSSSPLFFEQVVIDLLLAMGYGGSRAEAASLTKITGDEGIDGIIKEDRLGLDSIYVQAKRWEGVVGRKEVQAFAGSLEGARARKGVMMTTSWFSDGAEEFVQKIEKKIVLIDGERLADLMIEHNVGVSEAQRYVIKKVDTDYFGEE
jgi:restriction system protein